MISKSLFTQESPPVVDTGILSQYHWESGLFKHHIKLIFLPTYDSRGVSDTLTEDQSRRVIVELLFILLSLFFP